MHAAMTQPIHSSFFHAAPLDPDELAAVDTSLGWGERVRSLGCHAICWCVLALSAWPLVPAAVNEAVTLRVALAAHVAHDWVDAAVSSLLEEAHAETPRRECAPVCVVMHR